MKENTGNVEPTPLPETDTEGKPYPKSPPIQASKEDEAASLVTPNTPQVIPPDGEAREPRRQAEWGALDASLQD